MAQMIISVSEMNVEEVRRRAVSLSAASTHPRSLTPPPRPYLSHQLSCMERYVTASEFLMSVWFFVLAILPFEVLTIYCAIAYSFALWVWMLQAVMLLVLGVMGFFIFISLPQSMQANDSQGTRLILDYLLLPVLGGKAEGDEDGSWRSLVVKHAANDLLASAVRLTRRAHLPRTPLTCPEP